MAVQTCDQITTFRNFDYSRALEIVQDEEYLDDVNFDEIRVSRKQGEVFQAIDNFKEKVEIHRKKRSFFGSSCTITTTTNTTNTAIGAGRKKRSIRTTNTTAVLVRKKRSIYCSDSNTTPPGLPAIVGTVLTIATILKVNQFKSATLLSATHECTPKI